MTGADGFHFSGHQITYPFLILRLELVCTLNNEVVCQERISGEKVSPMCHMALNPISMEIVVCREQLIWIYNIVKERRLVQLNMKYY